MERQYSQISLEKRCEIYRLRADGRSRNGIARQLGRHPSTIGRELRRNALRDFVSSRKAWANILPKRNRKDSFAFSSWLYRQRNLVERFFNKLKQFRWIATRYVKNPENFLAAIKLASVRIWLRFYESTA